ncbi:MAG: FAD-binding oxidoreductase [Pseudomonadota bacterium]
MALNYNLKRDRDARIIKDWDAQDQDPYAAVGIPRQAWVDLQEAIQGRVVLPGSPDYDGDRKLSNPLFDEYPQAIVYCEGSSGSDVRAALATAKEYNMNVRSRSGGHSTAGYSTGPGMLIDLSDMKAAPIFGGNGTSAPIARAQPGCPFRNLNDALDMVNLHVPGGGCPDVCVAGYMQGGGFGFTSRMFGMNCDRVIGAKMLTADGQLVTASESQNADLFWAIRGGTGNQFGILTEIDYSLVEVPQVWGFALAWPLETPMQMRQAAKALYIMQEQYMADAPANDDIGYMTIICGQSEGGPTKVDGSNLKPMLLMRGMITGDALKGDDASLESRLAPLTATGAQMQWSQRGSYNMLNYLLLSHPNEIPDFPAGTPHPYEDKNARYVNKDVKLDVGDWTNLIELVTLQAPNPYFCLVIEPYGGAINKVGKMDTAFIHRDVSCDIFLDGFWWEGQDRTPVDKWLGDFNALMAPFWNGHVYQNYPSGALKDYRWNYFGDAYPTLQQVKQKYDPGGRFAFPQSITPTPADTSGLTVSTAKPLFPESPIES